MGKKAIYLLLILSLLVIGCSRKPSKTAQGYWDSATILASQHTYEAALEEYQKILKFYPEDELAIKSLFAMADIQKNNLQDNRKAITIYQKILDLYPDSERTPNAKFMMGYLYANEIKDLKKARQQYNEFLELFPEHDLALSAQLELDHLGNALDDIPQLKSLSEEEESAE